jgi:hypothetical protein
MSSWLRPRVRTSNRRPWIHGALSHLTCPMASVSCTDLLPENLGLNVPANSFYRDGAAFEHTSQGRRSMQLSAPKYLAPPSVDLALNVKVIASIVQNCKSQKHARTPAVKRAKSSDGVRRTRRLLPT